MFRTAIQKTIMHYLKKWCGGTFHINKYGNNGKYVVLMSEQQYHLYTFRAEGCGEILVLATGDEYNRAGTIVHRTNQHGRVWDLDIQAERVTKELYLKFWEQDKLRKDNYPKRCSPYYKYKHK